MSMAWAPRAVGVRTGDRTGRQRPAADGGARWIYRPFTPKPTTEDRPTAPPPLRPAAPPSPRPFAPDELTEPVKGRTIVGG